MNTTERKQFLYVEKLYTYMMRMCEGNHCGEQTNTQSKHLHLTADGAYFFNPEAKCTSIHAYQCVCHVCSAAVPSPSNVNYRNRIKKKNGQIFTYELNLATVLDGCCARPMGDTMPQQTNQVDVYVTNL